MHKEEVEKRKERLICSQMDNKADELELQDRKWVSELLSHSNQGLSERVTHEFCLHTLPAAITMTISEDLHHFLKRMPYAAAI